MRVINISLTVKCEKHSLQILKCRFNSLTHHCELNEITAKVWRSYLYILFSEFDSCTKLQNHRTRYWCKIRNLQYELTYSELFHFCNQLQAKFHVSGFISVVELLRPHQPHQGVVECL